VVLLAIGGLVAIRAVDHWARSERAMRLGQPLPPSRFPALLALAIAVGAAVLLVAIVTGGLQ
jgi:putative membrane protein